MGGVSWGVSGGWCLEVFSSLLITAAQQKACKKFLAVSWVFPGVIHYAGQPETYII